MTTMNLLHLTINRTAQTQQEMNKPKEIQEEEILLDIMNRTSVAQFNRAINTYNLQLLYDSSRIRIHLLHTYFGGNVLKHSVTMRRIFDRFQTGAQESAARELNDKMYWLKLEISRAKRFRRMDDEVRSKVTEYNQLCLAHNLLCDGINDLRKLFKKIQKSKAVAVVEPSSKNTNAAEVFSFNK